MRGLKDMRELIRSISRRDAVLLAVCVALWMIATNLEQLL